MKKAMQKVVTILAWCCALALCCYSNPSADEADWRIPTIDNPGDLSWGEQRRNLVISNISKDYKFLTIRCQILSAERDDSRLREVRTHHIVFPEIDTTLSYALDVPENFSPAVALLSLHEVVDTLDDLSWGVKLTEQRFDCPVSFPEGLSTYRDSLPRIGGMLRYHSILGTDLSLLTNYLFARGVRTEQIAELTDREPREVNRMASEQRRYHVIEVRDGAIQSELTLIEGLPYERLKEILDASAGEFADALSAALPRFRAVRDSLIAAGAATADSNDTMDGTALMHHLYPLLGGVALWEYAARPFFGTEGEPPELINRNYPCSQDNFDFDYLLIDSAAPDVRQLFFWDSGRNRRVFGVDVPPLVCTGQRDAHGRSYTFPEERQPVFYSFDGNRCEIAVRELADPLVEPTSHFDAELASAFAEVGQEVSPAHRSWLWNQLAQRTLDQLIQRGVVSGPHGRYFVWMGAIK